MAADKKDDKHDKKDIPVKDSDGAASADGAGELPPPKKFNAKKIILIVVPIIILLSAVGAAYFLGYIGPKKEADCTTVKAGDPGYDDCAKQLAAKAGANGPGTFIDIPPMIVNLTSNAKKPQFLKISLKVEVEKPEDEKTFEAAMPRVVDQFQTYLRELQVSDLQGSSGMYRMKIELLNRVRAAAPDITVKDVLFQEILIQ